MNAAISFPTMRNGASHLNGFDIQIEAIKSMVQGYDPGSGMVSRGFTSYLPRTECGNALLTKYLHEIF